MKKVNPIVVLISLCVLVGGGLAIWSLTAPPVQPEGDVKVGVASDSDGGTTRKITKKRPKKVKTGVVRSTPKDKARAQTAKNRTVEADASDEDDERTLNLEQKKVLADLQAALDNEDLATVRRVLDRLNSPAMKTAAGGEVPVSMRSRAVEALGWFGKSAAIDLIGYLGDPDSDVAQDALSQFEMALEDGAMGDLERSVIVKAAMKAITDPDIIESLLNQLNNMRNSVKADTIEYISTAGTAQAQATMKEQLEFYTDDGVTDVESVRKWKAENPDDEGDEELYGGEKESEDGSSARKSGE